MRENDLPPGWVASNLRELTAVDGVLSDGDWVESKDQDPQGDVRLIQLADVGDGRFLDKSSRFLTSAKAAELGCTFLKAGDVLISRMADPIGRACVFPGDPKTSCTVVDVAVFRPGSVSIDTRWAMHAINASPFRADIESRASGTTRKRISRSNLETVPLHVPPLAEQRRIVDKIESLFARSRKAKESLDRIPPLLDKLKKSILAAAFRGELTNRSRPWPTAALPDFAEACLGKMLDKQKPRGDLLRPYLRNENVRWHGFNLDDVYSMPFGSGEMERFGVRDGDILVCEGGEPGRAAVWRGGPTDLMFQKAIHRIRVNKDVVPEWVAYRLEYDAMSGNLEQYFTGTTIKHFTGQSLARYTIPLPPKHDQETALARMLPALKRVETVRSVVARERARVDALESSILSRAFRGELVPQDPNDEPASVLLDRIRAERAAAEPVKKARTPRKRAVTTR